MPTETDIVARMSILVQSDVVTALARDEAALMEMDARVKSLSANYMNAGVASTGMAQRTAEVATATTNMGRQADGLTQRLGTATRALGTFGTEARVASSLIGGAGSGFALAGIAAGAYAIKTAADFQSAQVHVLAFTSTSQAQLAQVTEAVKALSLQTGVSASDLMNSYYQIASSGLSAAKSQEVLVQSTKFAAATQTDASVATGLLTAVTNAYHLGLKDIPAAQDAITQSLKIGTMEAAQFAPALAQVIPTAARLGIGLKELGAFFAVLTNQGISAAESGVYINNMFNRLLNPTYQQIRAVEALGGSYDDLTVHGGKVMPTLERINQLVINAVPNVKSLENAHGDLTRRQEIFVQQLEHANSRVALLFGGNTDAMKSFFALFASGGGQTHKALSQMEQDVAATQKAFDTSMGSVEKQANRAREAIHLFALETGTEVLPAVKATLGPLADIAAAMTQVEKKTEIAYNMLMVFLGPTKLVADVMGVGKHVIDALTGSTDHLTERQRLLSQANDEQRMGFTKAAEELRKRVALLDKNAELERTNTAAMQGHLSIQHQMTTAEGQEVESLHKLAAAYTFTASQADKYTSLLETRYRDALSTLAGKLYNKIAVTSADIAAVEKAKTAQDRWSDALDRATKMTDTAAQAIAAYTQQAQELERQGLARHAVNVKAMADTGIAQATRMRTGVVDQVKQMMAEVAKPVVVGPLRAPAELSAPIPHDTYSAIPHGTAESVLSISPEATSAMKDLQGAIGKLPPDFRSMMSGVTSGFRDQLTALYNGVVDKLNAENRRYADVTNRLNQDAHDKIQAAFQRAQEQRKSEDERYAAQLRQLDDHHAADLAGRLQTFTSNFATVLANFQAGLAQWQAQSTSIQQGHNDRLGELYNTYIQRLHDIHGSNAAEQRRILTENYNRSVASEDRNYARNVTVLQQHVTGMTRGFDAHISNMRDTFAHGNTDAEKRYQNQLKGDDARHRTNDGRIQTILDGHVKGIDSTTAKALDRQHAIHMDHVTKLQGALNSGADKISKAMQQAATPGAILSDLQKAAQDQYNEALASATLDMLSLGHVTSDHADKLRIASGNLGDLTSAQDKVKVSMESASKSAADFATTLTNTQQALTYWQNYIAGLIQTGQQNFLHPLTAGQQALNRAEPGAIPQQTQMQYAMDQLVQAYKDNQTAVQSNRAAQLIAAQQTHDWTAILQISADDIKTRVDTAFAMVVQGVQGGAEAYAQAIALQQAAQQQQINALNETGQFAQALSARMKSATDTLSDATAKVTQDFYDHGSASRADIDAVTASRAATEKWTQAQWDATFSTASLSEQQKMLASRFSELISRNSTISGAQSAVDNASLGIIAANSSIAVQAIQTQTTAIQDAAGILTAHQAVQAAAFNGTKTGIDDQTKLLQDQLSLLQATTPAQLRTAQETLAVDRLTADMHRAEAQWAVRIAQDQVRLAQDKAAADAANAAAQATLLQDALKIAQDSYQLAVDQQMLTIDQLAVLTDISSSLGSVNDYGQMISDALATLDRDRAQAFQDQRQQALDQATAALIAAQGAQTEALDNLRIQQDQGGAASTQQSYELQIAQLQREIARRNLEAQQQGNAQSQQQTQIQQQMDKKLQELIDQQRSDRDWMESLWNRPMSRENIVGDESTQDFMNSRGLVAQAAGSVTAK